MHPVTRLPAGYSRTNFYHYFADLFEVETLLKKIILFQLEYDEQTYWAFYQGHTQKAFTVVANDIAAMIKYETIFLQDNHFIAQQKKQVIKMIDDCLPKKKLTKDQKLQLEFMKETFAAYVITSVRSYYQHRQEISFTTYLKSEQKISQQLIQIFNNIMNS